jgi:hypothetical protein
MGHLDHCSIRFGTSETSGEREARELEAVNTATIVKPVLRGPDLSLVNHPSFIFSEAGQQGAANIILSYIVRHICFDLAEESIEKCRRDTQ